MMRMISFSLGVFVLSLDLVTKWWVKNSAWLHDYPVIEGFFTIQYVKNEGIAFGLLHTVQSEWKPILLSLIAVLAVVIVIYYIWNLPPEFRLTFVSLGLLLGGILGNFIDRLLNQHVIDFLTLHWRDAFVWPTFNIADAAITVGVVIMLVQTFSKERAASILTIIFLMPIATSTQASPASTPEQIIQQIQTHYQDIRTFQANFEQIHQNPVTTLRESGIVQMKKPGRMYWEYREPKEKYFVADGEKTYFYVPEDRQVLVSTFNPEESQSPLLFLLGKGDLQRDFSVEFESDEKPLDEENILLRLEPYSPQPGFTHLLLEVDSASYEIRRLAVIEPVGQRNDYVLTNVRKNVSIPEDRFKPKIPAGVEIIEQ